MSPLVLVNCNANITACNGLQMLSQPIQVFATCRYEFPEQEDLFEVDDSFLLGDGLLVAPVTIQGQIARNITFPAGAEWFSAETGERAVSTSNSPTKRDVAVTLDTVPAYYRGGSIVATRQRNRRSTEAAASVTFLRQDILRGLSILGCVECMSPTVVILRR